MDTKIIIITPVKNEEWILNAFLSTGSIVADHIIIADQNSSDNSRQICRNYPKVTVIENNSIAFNEADRQILLIETARKIFPNSKRILLALDADEIISANSQYTSEWQQMLNAAPGTILYFEKPTFLNGTDTVIRYDGEGFPLGYIDDGIAHKPTKMHSTRVPSPDYATKLYLKEIKVLHYGLARLDALQSKLRFYSCLECISGRIGKLKRRISYPNKLDLSSEGTSKEPVCQEWLLPWEELGIQLTDFPKQQYYWYDREVLIFFEKYGSQKFKSEDIWSFNWQEANNYFASLEVPIQLRLKHIQVIKPSLTVQITNRILTFVYSKALKFYVSLKKGIFLK